MSLSMGLVNSEEQVFIRIFDDKNDQLLNKRISCDDLSKEKVDLLFFKKEGPLEVAQEQAKYIPVRKAEDFQIEAEKFQTLTSQEAWAIYNGVQSKWSLSNNISLLNELFAVLEHLKNLYPNERTTFFEELWFILKRNLGSYELKVIYNDIIKAKKDNQKDELTRNFVSGHNLPEIKTGGELEEKLMEHYKANFAENFEICDYDSEKNELVLTATVQGSPILIMAKVSDLTSMQKALIKTLFDGLNA